MKNTAKKMLGFLLIICITLTLLPISTLAVGSDTIVQIAKGEVGTSGSPNKYTRWLGTISGSYDYWWCAAFVSWCASQAGESSAIPATASVYVLNNSILKAGGKKVSSPQAGDIVIYRRKADNYYAHVGIMENSTTSIEGNYGNAVCRGIKPNTYDDTAGSTVANGKIEVIYLRPNYKGKTQETKIEFFDCDVTIFTKGTVNLYKNINDSQRADYFDRSQTAYSTKGAKVNDGSTWYQIQAYQNNKVTKLWLNDKSTGVKIINNKTAPSLTFSSDSLSINPGDSKTVSIKFVGDDVQSIGGSINGQSLCDVSWGNTNWSARTTSLIITGKKAGTATISVNLMDKSGKTICSKDLSVEVNNSQASQISQGEISQGVYIIESAIGGVLDCEKGSQSACAHILLWNQHSAENQQFRVIPLDDGTYVLQMVHSNLVLDVEKANTKSTRVIQYGWHGAANQRWKIVPAGDGYYYIISALSSGMALDVSGGRANPGADIIVYQPHYGANQKWKFLPVK